jgi:sRNA-binding protein
LPNFSQFTEYCKKVNKIGIFLHFHLTGDSVQNRRYCFAHATSSYLYPFLGGACRADQTLEGVVSMPMTAKKRPARKKAAKRATVRKAAAKKPARKSAKKPARKTTRRVASKAAKKPARKAAKKPAKRRTAKKAAPAGM